MSQWVPGGGLELFRRVLLSGDIKIKQCKHEVSHFIHYYKIAGYSADYALATSTIGLQCIQISTARQPVFTTRSFACIHSVSIIVGFCVFALFLIKFLGSIQ